MVLVLFWPVPSQMEERLGSKHPHQLTLLPERFFLMLKGCDFVTITKLISWGLLDKSTALYFYNRV
jgi:hypothetical protein